MTSSYTGSHDTRSDRDDCNKYGDPDQNYF